MWNTNYNLYYLQFPSAILESFAVESLLLVVHKTLFLHGMRAGVVLGQDPGVVANGTLFTPI